MNDDFRQKMTKKQALEVLGTLVTTRGDDEAVMALAVLVSTAPPGRLAAARAEAAALTQQLHITGVAGGWETPPQHSEAMERLVHRLTVLLETMIDLLTDASSMEPES